MAVKGKKKGELHVSIGGSIVKAGRFEGEGSPLEGTAKELQAVNNTNAPIGSEFLDLVTGNIYVKIDDTPEITQGAYKKGIWILSGGTSNGNGNGGVSSVNGQQGNVVLTGDDIESSNGSGASLSQSISDKVNSVTTGEPTGSDKVLNIVSLTQAEYDAGTPIATTLYLIKDA